jgi:dTDP-glucose 4,6-dehydratase
MSKTILITGGAGFIGSNFIRYVMQHRSEYNIINVDSLTYSGNRNNLNDISGSSNYQFVHGNICDQDLMDSLVVNCDAVINFAAESHVDRSINNRKPFVLTNITGTATLLESVMKFPKCRYIQISTDEVYGELDLDTSVKKFTELTPLSPNSPYASSKASADLLVQSYHHTFGLDTLITRCSNNFGPFQYPEKLIPRFITNLLQGKNVTLYGDGKNVRDWIHVLDHCSAILTVLENGQSGEIFNIGSNNERSNIEITQTILQLLNLSVDRIEYVEDRLGHDRRYAIDSSKIQNELGWRPIRTMWPEVIEETILWYVNHEFWWREMEVKISQAA